jgi:hypothetical protein
MWLANLPPFPECLEIELNIDKKYQLGGLLLWNYNKSLIDSIKGAKDIEVNKIVNHCVFL